MAGIVERCTLGIIIFCSLLAARPFVSACFSPLGMKSLIIPNEDITSSVSSEPAHGARLDSRTRWLYSANSGKQPWIQIRLNRKNNITGVATQGELGIITQYYVAFSTNGSAWQNYTENGVVKLFAGNTKAGNTYTVTNNLTSPVLAQFFRLYPTQCKPSSGGYCGLRMELYGCVLSPPPGLPGKPTNLQLTSVTSTSLAITWTAPAAGGSPITGYEIKYYPDGSQESATEKLVTKTSAALSQLRPFTMYAITVTALSSYGRGPQSDAVRQKTSESVPDAVPSLTVTSSKPLSLAVSWKFIPSDRWNGVQKGYKLKYYKDGQQQTTKITLPSSSNRYEISNLEPNGYYYVEVAGYTNAGIGPWKKSSRTRVKEGAPSVPRNVRIVKVDKRSVDLSWDKPETANGVLQYYNVHYGLSKTSLKNRRLSYYSYKDVTVRYTLSGLEEYKKYFVRISASTSLEGEKSPLLDFTTLEDVPDGQPSIVKHSSGALDAYRIKIVWEPVPDLKQNGVINSYTVYYKENGCKSSKPYSEKKVNDGKTFETVVSGLKAFTLYGFKMKAWTRIGIDKTDLAKIPCVEIKSGQAGPSAPREVNVETLSSTSVRLTWKTPSKPNGEIQQYHIFYNQTREKLLLNDYLPVIGTTTTHVITNLKKYTKYFFAVRGQTSFAGNLSEIISNVTFEDTPGPPQMLTLTEITDKNVLVTWKTPVEANGIIRNYTVVLYYNGTNNIAGEYSTNGNHLTKYITDLKPWTSYRVTVRGYTIGLGEEASSTFKSKEGEPSPPRNVEVALKGKYILATWEEPEHPNGIVDSYHVFTVPSRSYDKSFKQNPITTVVSADNRQTKLSPLLKGTKYEIYVQAVAGERLGIKSERRIIETPAAAPPAPESPRAYKENVTAKTVTISLKPASLKNGNVILHQLIVEKLSSIARRKRNAKYASGLKSYKGAKEMGLPYYIAAEWNNTPLPKTFVVGDGKTYGGYYNAPLQPDSQYSVSLRAATKHPTGLLQYSYGKDQRLPRTAPSAVRKNTSNTGVIAGVVGGILLVAILIIVFLLYKRSTRPLNANIDVENAKGKKRKGLELKRLSVKKRPLSFTGEPGSDPDHPPIAVDHFAKHVSKLHKSDDRGFMIEYNKLDSGRDYPCDAAHTEENKNKNRYGNIVAYDHSRVILKREEGSEDSDYINASHIDGYNKPNAYIATQGPIPSTFDDFWQMIWDQQSSTIVMLTNLQERHKLKCHKYWPDEKEEFGDLLVTMTKEEHYADYVIRTFSVKKEKEKEERELKQFHFTVWPDHGVPEYATAILAFRRRVRAFNPPDSGPMIVHCSAGVGRSGTFIVIDTTLDRINAEATVDIFNYVAYLRSRRTAMVQTEEQYVFCHDAILEAVQCGNTQILAHDLRIILRKMDEFDKDLKMNRFEAEFKTLNRVSPVLPKTCFIVSSYPENKEKNRHQDILASDYARVVLTAVDDNEFTTYINAVHIAGYKQQHAFIVTQYPLTNTFTDFWRMLCEQQSACIVTFNSPEEEGDFPQFWPEEESKTYDDMIKVETLPADANNADNSKTKYNTEDIQERRFKVIDQKSPEKHSIVKQFQLTSWPQEDEPPTTASIIALITKVEKWQQQSGNGPITVMCGDGISRSGTFCALYSVLERVKIEQVVDVFQAIKAMRIQQQGLVKTVSQYRFIHYGVQQYLMAFDDYANFK